MPHRGAMFTAPPNLFSNFSLKNSTQSSNSALWSVASILLSLQRHARRISLIRSAVMGFRFGVGILSDSARRNLEFFVWIVFVQFLISARVLTPEEACN